MKSLVFPDSKAVMGIGSLIIPRSDYAQQSSYQEDPVSDVQVLECRKIHGIITHRCE